MAYWTNFLHWLQHTAAVLAGAINSAALASASLQTADYIAISALVISIIALVIAERRFRGTFRSIRTVAESVSTRNIGPFPDHIRQITNLIRSTKDSIVILADCVDYGSFRAFDLHESLLSAICDKGNDGRKITFLLWGDVQPMSRANRYRDAASRSDPHFPALVRELLLHLRNQPGFVENFRKDLAPVEKYLERQTNWSDPRGDAIRKLQRLQGRFHNDIQLKKLEAAHVSLVPFRSPGEVRNITVDNDLDEEPSPPELFWIVDNEHAVFILPQYRDDALAFYTHDRQLVSTLMQMFDRRHRYAIDHPTGV